MTKPTPEQLDILQHTIGVRADMRVPYRNRYLAGPGHHANAHLEALVLAGLMTKREPPKFCDPTDVLYMCTEAGQQAAIEGLPPPPKSNRYDDWLAADCGYTFSEYLRIANPPKMDAERTADGKWRYRMYRRGFHSVAGDWASTKKEAKASYKAALPQRGVIWSGAMLDALGTAPDRAIAQSLGLSLSTIRRKRTQCGIKPSGRRAKQP